MDKLDKTIRSIKELGTSVGVVFPAEAPPVTLLGPNAVKDHLAFSSDENVLHAPEFPDFFEDVELDEETKKVLMGRLDVREKATEGFRVLAKEAFMELFKVASRGLLEFENKINFYL